MGKFKEYVCIGLYDLIAKHLPKSNARVVGSACKNLRSGLASGFIKHCGKNANLQKGAVFCGKLSIGENSSLGINSVIQGPVTIGKNVMMGPECYIYTQNHRHDSTNIPMIEQGYEDEKPVVIEDDVWIGSRVTILPGVTIGEGSIIGGGGVVTKNVPPYSVVAGNPARIVKNRKEAE